MRIVVVIGILSGLVGNAHADDECAQYATRAARPDQVINRAISLMSECVKEGWNGTKAEKIRYWLDRSDVPPSEIARVFLVSKCYPGYHGAGEIDCGVDAHRMNKAAFDGEVAKLQLSAERKAKVSAYWDKAQKAVADAQKDLDWAFGAQPAMKQVLAAADAAYKEWDEFYAQNKTLIDAANRVEDKWWKTDEMQRMTSFVDLGCDDLRAEWRKRFATFKLTSYKHVPDTISHDELAVLALRSLALCDAAGGRQADALPEIEALSGAYPYRGPRSHAIQGALAAMAKLIPENIVPVMAPTKSDDFVRKATKERAENNFAASRASEPDHGTLAAMRKVPDGVELTFKKVTWMEPDFDCKPVPSSRWWSTVDGRWKYDFSCKQVGSHPESSELKPQIVSAPSAEGLKVGQVVTLQAGSRKDVVYGFPLESRTPSATAAKKAKGKKPELGDASAGALNVLYGVPLP